MTNVLCGLEKFDENMYLVQQNINYARYISTDTFNPEIGDRAADVALKCFDDNPGWIYLHRDMFKLESGKGLIASTAKGDVELVRGDYLIYHELYGCVVVPDVLVDYCITEKEPLSLIGLIDFYDDMNVLERAAFWTGIKAGALVTAVLAVAYMLTR